MSHETLPRHTRRSDRTQVVLDEGNIGTTR
jgi:hypothetical protein